jgi:CRP-like cAMP-binding protein
VRVDNPIVTARGDDPKVDQLRLCPLFAPLADDELAEITGIAEELRLPAGRLLTRQGAAGRQAFILVAGRCRVFVADVEVATLGPGDIVAEMALLEPNVRSETVVAMTPVQLLVVDPRRLNALLERRTIRLQRLHQLASSLRHPDRRADGSGVGS